MYWCQRWCQPSRGGYVSLMSSGDYPKNVPSAGLIGLVAGGLGAAFSNGSAIAFWLTGIVVGALALTILNELNK